MKSLESYLREVHKKEYRNLDDDMVDDFEVWLTRLDSDTFLDLAEDWHKEETKTLMSELGNRVPTSFNSQKKSVDEISEFVNNRLVFFKKNKYPIEISNFIYGEGE